MEKADDIKEMKLYQNFERLDNEIKLLREENSEISVEQIYKFDTMHYHGVQSVEEAVGPFAEKLSKETEGKVKVLDVGSGLGGPARYMAENMNCEVLAVEIQKEANDYAEKVTESVKAKNDLKKLVIHQAGDINALIVNEDLQLAPKFDLISSFLTYLHIDDKKALFKNLRSVTKKGGFMVVEDYYRKTDEMFTNREKEILNKEVYCNAELLPTKDEYINVLKENGFKVVEFTDMTNDWSAFVKERFEAYLKSKDRQLKVHGEPTFKSQSHFYRAVNEIFMNGDGNSTRLGGVRYICEAV